MFPELFALISASVDERLELPIRDLEFVDQEIGEWSADASKDN